MSHPSIKMGGDRNDQGRDAAAVQRAIDSAARKAAPKDPQNTPGSGVMSRTSTPNDWSALKFKLGNQPEQMGPTPSGAPLSSTIPTKPDWRGQNGIANPPPIGNQNPQVTTTTRLPSMRSAITPKATGTEGDAYADNALRNAKALYAPHDTTKTTPVGTAPRIATNQGTPQLEAEADARFGSAPKPTDVAGTGAPAWTPYGMISSRTASPKEATPKPATTADGVSRPPAYDPKAHAQQRAALYSDPTTRKIWDEGSPENVAFVAHAKQFGEASAHENLKNILQGAARNPTANNAATAIPSGNSAAPAPFKPIATSGGDYSNPPLTAYAPPQKPMATRNLIRSPWALEG